MKIRASIILLFLWLTHGNAQIITTIAGNGTAGFSGDGGPAVNAQFFTPSGVFADGRGNIYLADNFNGVIHKIDTNGVMTRFAGNGTPGYSGDGGQATDAQIELYVTVGIAVDTLGNVYFSAPPRIRMVSPTGLISTIVGNGSIGNSGDGGPATLAELSTPTGICFDKAGNMYIGDAGINNSNIRKVNSAGIISTVAGTGTFGFSGDGGPATGAKLKEPQAIAIDDSGNIYFADMSNFRIRKINTFGIINTFAGGDPSGIQYCTGCSALVLKLNAVIGVAVDHFNNIYFSDALNTRIYKITKDGLAYNLAGNGIQGYTGDGGPAINSELYHPNMICFDNASNMLIADKGNYRFRKVWYATNSVPSVNKKSPALTLSPNPVLHDELTCNITSAINEDASLVVTNMLGQVVFRVACPTNKSKSIQLSAPPGIYFVTATTSAGKVTSKLIIE